MSLDPQPGADHPAVVNQLRHHFLDKVCRDRKADAPRVGNDRSGNPNDVAATVDQRATGVAGIDRGVRLQQRLRQRPRSAREHTIDCRYYPACDCLVQSERVPDGVCFVTDPHAIRITELSRWESALFGSGDPDQRQVENRVCAHWRRRQCGTVIQDHRNCSAPEDHVGIGQYEAGRVDDHARSHDALDPVFSVVRVDRGRPNQDHHRGNSLIQCWKRFLAGVNPG